ncbi:MAG TPA: glycosyltransferase [Burkholderiaceae bacterium]|nr:glycosyltransferase [Burkholderiaceae bacterium]
MTFTVAHVSTYAPTQCGIGAYTQSLVHALRGCRQAVVAMDYGARARAHVEPPVVAGVPLRSGAAMRQAAAQVNAGPVDVVSLQHEFGIYGGPHGVLVTEFTRALRKPLVVTLHTLSAELEAPRRAILEEIFDGTARVVVLTPESAEVCRALFPRQADRVRVIPHGVPAVRLRAPRDVPLRRRLDADWVFVASGHTWRHKGYHHALLALSLLDDEGLDFKFVILGAGQAQFGGADAYEASLARLATKLGLAERIVRVPEYLPQARLLDWFSAADAGLVTYTRAAHNSSGVLPTMLACGRPVVATRFEYARAIAPTTPDVLLADIADPDDIAARLRELVADRRHLAARRRRAWRQMQPRTWPKTAASYRAVFVEAMRDWRA